MVTLRSYSCDAVEIEIAISRVSSGEGTLSAKTWILPLCMTIGFVCFAFILLDGYIVHLATRCSPINALQKRKLGVL